MKKKINFEITDTYLKLDDSEILAFHSKLKIFDEEYAKIGRSLAYDNYNSDNWIVVTILDKDSYNILDCTLGYILDADTVAEIEALSNGNILRENVYDSIVLDTLYKII